MASQFDADTEAMQAASVRIHGVAEDLQARVAMLRKQIDDTQGLLLGAAPDAFRAAMAEWDVHARRFNESVHAMGSVVGTTGGTYTTQTADDARAFRAGSITDALG